jgi:hypothetical protein
MTKTPEESLDTESLVDPLKVAAEALEVAVQRAKDHPENPRFRAFISPTARLQSELWLVFDTHLNITVFHWQGRTAQTKANVVAQALNALGHEHE